MFNLIVGLLIATLGDHDFRVREKAHRALDGMLDASIAQLKVAESHEDAEVACRCSCMVNRWYNAHAMEIARETFPLFMGKLPWIDSLPDDYPNRYETTQGYLELARAKVEQKSGFEWPDYRMATLLWLRDMIASRQPYHGWLNRMQEREWRWMNENPGAWK